MKMRYVSDASIALTMPEPTKASDLLVISSNLPTTKKDRPSAKNTNHARTTALSANDNQASKNFDVGLNIRVRIEIGPMANANARMALDITTTMQPTI